MHSLFCFCYSTVWKGKKFVNVQYFVARTSKSWSPGVLLFRVQGYSVNSFLGPFLNQTHPHGRLTALNWFEKVTLLFIAGEQHENISWLRFQACVSCLLQTLSFVDRNTVTTQHVLVTSTLQQTSLQYHQMSNFFNLINLTK